MKYTKKVPYFKKGDKVDKVDKALKKLPKKQKEAILKISSAQKEQERKDKLSSVGAGFKKPTAKVEGPKTSQASKIKPVEKKPEKPVAKTRDEAFAQARKANKKEFIWEGNPYHTRTAEEEAKRKAEEEAERKEETPVPEEEAEVEETPVPDTNIRVRRIMTPDRTNVIRRLFGWQPPAVLVESDRLMDSYVTRTGGSGNREKSVMVFPETGNKYERRINNKGDTTYTNSSDAFKQNFLKADTLDSNRIRAEGYMGW